MRSGITLAEILIAMLVMVLGILPVLTLFSSEDRETAFIGQKLIVETYLHELADLTQSSYIGEHFSRGAFDSGPQDQLLPPSRRGFQGIGQPPDIKRAESSAAQKRLRQLGHETERGIPPVFSNKPVVIDRSDE